MSETKVTNPICTVDPACGSIATASYVWDWGESGLCCPQHQVVLTQKSHSLKRNCRMTALQPGAERPVTRQERIEAHATRLALEAELDEARQRGQELYRSVEQLQAQLRTCTAQRVELAAQLESARRETAEAQAAAGELRTQLGKENAELQQLRALVPKAPPESPPESPQKLDLPPKP